MSMIRRAILTIDQNSFCHILCLFVAIWQTVEIDIGPRDKPQLAFISKKLDPSLREPMIALLKEYSDCFAWDYMEMPGLDRSIVEHRLPLKKGFRPFQQ
jgi:hypothetical protein